MIHGAKCNTGQQNLFIYFFVARKKLPNSDHSECTDLMTIEFVTNSMGQQPSCES